MVNDFHLPSSARTTLTNSATEAKSIGLPASALIVIPALTRTAINPTS